MSNRFLDAALADLRRSGAAGLPSSSAVESADDGSNWSGKKANGDPWTLVKNGPDSFNASC